MIAMKQDTPHDAHTRFNGTCLTPDELRRVIHGELPVDQFDAAIAHLDQCDECRAAAESLQSSDLSACGDAPVDELQNEAACQAAMLRLMQTPASEYPASIRSFLLEDALPRHTLGPYRILGPLGSGGMSTVLLAQHERLKRRFAIKLLPRERVDHPGWLSRFEREMVAAAALEHTHVVRTTDAGHEDGWHFLVMEYLDGLDVGCISRRVGPLAVSDACEIVRQAALGLAHIHAASLVHRDIKPSNLMLTRSGTVKVLDLGLVLDGDDPICVDDRLTTVGHLMGTVAFMSPEQLADSRNVDHRADLYSLGATLFRLIAGRSPHERHGGLSKQILAITQNDAPRLDSIRDDLAEDVVRLVAEMLARDPSERPASADEIAARLETPAAGHRLKKLVSTAAKTADEAGSVWHTTSPSAATSGEPPRRKFGAWIGGGMFAAFLLAAIVFKIQTDRGELVVHSDLDGLTVNIKQDDELVEQLEISSDQDNHIVLRKGTYRVEIEGGGEALRLSDEVVTIGRGTTSDVQITGNANQVIGVSGADSTELYQGHDMDYWMQVLENERDVKAAGEAIIALEVLSRGTDTRRNAAARTLELARRWGSQIVTAEPEGTETRTDQGRANFYMGYLVNVFPEYLPMPGLEAIDEELKNGNAKSRVVSALLLNTYRSAIAGSGYVSRKQRTLAIDDIERLAEDPETQTLLQSLVDQLHSLCTVNKKRDSFENEKMKISMQDCGLWLGLAIDPDLTENDWIASLVEPRVIERSGKWSAKDDQGNQVHPNSHHVDYLPGRTQNQDVWGITEDELLAATRLREQGVLSAECDAYLCAAMLDKWYERYSHRSDDAVAYLAENAADRLLEQTARALNSMKMLLVDEWSQQRGYGRGTLGEMPVSLLADENSIWKFALPFFAEHVTPDDAALELLGELKKTMTNFTSRQDDKTSSIRLDAAITRLQERHDAQVADPDLPQNDPVDRDDDPATD